jgi:hypothetical protein
MPFEIEEHAVDESALAKAAALFRRSVPKIVALFEQARLGKAVDTVGCAALVDESRCCATPARSLAWCGSTSPGRSGDEVPDVSQGPILAPGEDFEAIARRVGDGGRAGDLAAKRVPVGPIGVCRIGRRREQQIGVCRIGRRRKQQTHGPES